MDDATVYFRRASSSVDKIDLDLGQALLVGR